jgi:antitoxin (DNA-binding transcriptional repressor) of toxin-antitoxin stability system
MAIELTGSVSNAARIEGMATVHMTYHEVSSNFAAVLENIRKGVEVVVEQDNRPVAVIRSPKRYGRPSQSA